MPKGYTNCENTRTGLAWANVNPIDALLAEDEGFAARYGCELVRDDYALYFLSEAGSDRGFRVKYGRNLDGVTATVNTDALKTRVIPVGETRDGEALYLTDGEDGVNWVDSRPTSPTTRSRTCICWRARTARWARAT